MVCGGVRSCGGIPHRQRRNEMRAGRLAEHVHGGRIAACVGHRRQRRHGAHRRRHVSQHAVHRGLREVAVVHRHRHHAAPRQRACQPQRPQLVPNRPPAAAHKHHDGAAHRRCGCWCRRCRDGWQRPQWRGGRVRQVQVHVIAPANAVPHTTHNARAAGIPRQQHRPRGRQQGGKQKEAYHEGDALGRRAQQCHQRQRPS